jgi:hypothetical protein
VEGTVSALHTQDPSALTRAIAAANRTSPAEVEAERDALINALENAARTLRLHNDLVAALSQQATAAPRRDVPFIPEDQVLSLMQSAIAEFIPEGAVPAAPFDPRDPRWISVAWEKLKALFRGKHTFIQHTSLDSFQLQLPDRAVVVLFSDWGTGEETAKRVMRQIKRQNPTHAIHLGDVYYSGTNDEIRERFLDIIDAEGPSSSNCKYLALNSNHEMYSGGHAYFELTLKNHFRQEASYLPSQCELAADRTRLRLRRSRAQGSATRVAGSATRRPRSEEHSADAPPVVLPVRVQGIRAQAA